MNSDTLPEDLEAALWPDAPIVDAHHHLWRDQSWSDIYVRDYGPDDFIRDAEGLNLVATIYVECNEAYWQEGPESLRPVGETAFARAASKHAAGSAALCAGIIGQADLLLGAAVGEVLDAHTDAGEGHFRGVRARVAHETDPAMPASFNAAPAGRLLEQSFREGAAELERRNLILDVWLHFPQLPDLVALADACPDLQIVLNHTGGYLAVGRYADNPLATFARWRELMAEVARRPNVALKLGGLGMRAASPHLIGRPQGAGSAEIAEMWRPHFETAVGLFEPQRCMLESNFPVDKLAVSYRELWNVFKRLAGPLTPSERTAIFSGTATRVYGLNLPEPVRSELPKV